MLTSIPLAAATVALLAWIYLVLLHHRFWRADQRLPPSAISPTPATDAVAVVPARDEADVIGAAIASLIAQPGLRIVVVDDGSDDGTPEVARRTAREAGAADRVTILAGRPRPAGWTGKLWAVAQGVEHAERLDPPPRYLLLTDADIRHPPGHLAALHAKAERDRLDLVSIMVKLHCASAAERLLIPAFVFFFQKLYPFPAVNDRTSRIAGAAGGCMLVRTEALARIGGIAAIRGALIDDCALARAIKPHGPIWLGLSTDTTSLRPYGSLGEIWRMVARAAYTQLRHSPLLLLGTMIGMSLLYLAPPIALIAGILAQSWTVAVIGAAACGLMALAYAPTLRLYALSPLRAFTLPLAALLYTAMTVDSARRHWRGRGGEWKGRLAGGVIAEPTRTKTTVVTSTAER